MMADADSPDTSSLTTPPRQACLFCKKRKLRCNKQVPQCDSCLKYGFECEYVQPKEPTKVEPKIPSTSSHTKRFEDRLERVENLILQATDNGKRKWVDVSPSNVGDDGVVDIGLGCEFSDNDICELEKLFFIFVAPSVNIIHEVRHTQQCGADSSNRPPDFLRHAMCCLAAYASRTHLNLKDALYQSARRLLQDAEIKDQDFDKVTIAHAQTWIMIAVYELKECFLHRSLMSISRAVRLVQLLRLYCVDRNERLPKPAPKLISSPADWLQAEERRRLFWFVFLMDRYTAVSMGWPVLLDTRDIRTLLPVSDEAYQSSTFQNSLFLDESASWENHHLLSNFAAQVVGVDLCHTRVQGLNRLELKSDPSDWMGDIWTVHTQIETLLEGIYPIPQQLTIPPAKLTPSNVILNMAQAATIIMTHKIAKYHLQSSPMSQEMLKSGAEKSYESAENILRLMKMTSHWNIHMHHFITSFCIYTAAMVFGASWSHDGNDIKSRDSFRFLIDCLSNLKKTTRLPINLLGDLEDDLPGLMSRLQHGSEAEDIFQEYTNVNIGISCNEVDPSAHPLVEDLPGPVVQEGLIPDLSTLNLPFDVTAWTVDDPDIANVGRYM